LVKIRFPNVKPYDQKEIQSRPVPEVLSYPFLSQRN
jgi:hypothetical protein